MLNHVGADQKAPLRGSKQYLLLFRDVIKIKIQPFIIRIDFLCSLNIVAKVNANNAGDASQRSRPSAGSAPKVHYPGGSKSRGNMSRKGIDFWLPMRRFIVTNIVVVAQLRFVST